MAKNIEIYFATNRDMKSRSPAEFGRRFHRNGAECYRVGKATVSSNSGNYELKHAEVMDERRGGAGDDRDSKLGSAALFREIKNAMKAGGRDLIVLVHGYASDFSTAAERGAELAEKYTIRGKDGKTRSPVVLVFSWPANGETVPFASYVSDRHDAAQSGRAIGRLFLRVCDFLMSEAREERRAKARRDSGDKKADKAIELYEACPYRVHLVAHSMGNWALRHAVQAIVEMRGADRLPSIFDNIFLMAADEDNDTLQDASKLGALPRLGNAVHVYHSKDDTALVISDTTKLNPDRLGANGPVDMENVDEKVTAIDCRHVDRTELTHANHQYYRLRPEVIADVRQVLAGVPPREIKNRSPLDHRSRFIINMPSEKKRRR